MRIFQNSGIYQAYLPRLARLVRHATSFAEMRAAFLADRYGACHLLQPVLEGDDSAFFTNGDDESLQRLWAAENGLRGNSNLEEILIAQIESHRAEIFYNLDPMRWGSAFLKRLPACVRHSIAWRAAPSPGADFGAYDLIVCNFPSILASYEAQGWRSAYFTPAHDPVMDSYAANQHRPIDLLFVGGYSRHHSQRAQTLVSVARLSPQHHVRFHLDRSRLTRLAESPLGWLPGLREHRRPVAIRQVSADPVFGLDLYEAMSQAKIVLNGAVDMAGRDRGNMRCFEALGCGAVMVSDAGNYPAGFEPGVNMLVYDGPNNAAALIRSSLADAETRIALTNRGKSLVQCRFSKSQQWRSFCQLVEAL
jgi:hypothetical protein